MMEDFTILLCELAVLGGVFSLAGLVADFILPHIPPLTRWIDSLPMMWEDEEGGDTDA